MTCRHCGKPLSSQFIDLGATPLSNAYLTSDAMTGDEHKYPLRLYVCENCWLVQTEDFAGSRDIFQDDYAYFSGFSSNWVKHCSGFVEYARERFNLNEGSFAVEIASNDGTLLQFFKEYRIPCLGVEPTNSTASAARSRGLEVIEDFFGEELARAILKGNRSADFIVANNVIAHVPDINDFTSGLRILLKPGGVVSCEFPYLVNLVRMNQFDTIYHEHYSYFSFSSINRIFCANGLEIFDVEHIPTHGGSLRVFASRTDKASFVRSENVTAIQRDEELIGVESPSFYRSFQKKAETVRNELRSFLDGCLAGEMKIAAYGAAAKGNTLLNYSGIDVRTIPYVVDRNPWKQGKFLPGSRIPIVSDGVLSEEKPDIILILPWNLKDEIMMQLDYTRNWGAKFVTAIPGLVLHD